MNDTMLSVLHSLLVYI